MFTVSDDTVARNYQRSQKIAHNNARFFLFSVRKVKGLCNKMARISIESDGESKRIR